MPRWLSGRTAGRTAGAVALAASVAVEASEVHWALVGQFVLVAGVAGVGIAEADHLVVVVVAEDQATRSSSPEEG